LDSHEICRRGLSHTALAKQGFAATFTGKWEPHFALLSVIDCLDLWVMNFDNRSFVTLFFLTPSSDLVVFNHHLVEIALEDVLEQDVGASVRLWNRGMDGVEVQYILSVSVCVQISWCFPDLGVSHECVVDHYILTSNNN
jgi:hypothetical protein